MKFKILSLMAVGVTVCATSLLGQDFIWTQTSAPNTDWTCIASSPDGTKLAAGVDNSGTGGFYASTDSGLTWTQTSGTNGHWRSIVSSSDGTKLAAVADGGYISTSANSGLTWTQTTASSAYWVSIASSSDGTKLAAVFANTDGTGTSGAIYISTDSGLTWTQTSAPSLYWFSIASSSDGTQLAAVVGGNGGGIYASTNSGLTWIQTSAPNQRWYSIASSSDGSRLVAAVRSSGIYTSTNAGGTWAQTTAPNQNWQAVASSTDGTQLAAAVFGGGIYASANSGSTWTLTSAPNSDWYSIASSADGTKLAAAVFGGDIYIGTQALDFVITVADPTIGGVVTGGGTLNVGSQVQIVATANTGWTFTDWNDGSTQNPRTITVPSNDVAYVANFTTNTAVVTVIASPSDGGTVSGAGIFEIASQVQMSATPYDGWTFTGWSDGSSQNPRTITVPSGGLAYAASFGFVPTSASYSGLFYDTNGIVLQSSGFFSLTLTAKGTFTGKLLLAGETYSFSGSFSEAGSASNSVSISKTNRLTVLLGFDSGGRDILNGQISGGDWTAELVANRAVYSKTNLAPEEGKYTVLIPGSSIAAQPGGDGFGTVTVDHYGNLAFSGTLGDGSTVSQTAVVSGKGQWPFYASLYSGKGSILGWLTFTNEPASDIAGAAVWTKLPQPTAKFYPAGFTNQTDAVGSLFQFTNGVPVLGFAAGELWLTNGNLVQSFTNQFALGKNSKVTDTNKMSLTISTSTGRFTGSVVNPATKKTIPIYGAVLQKQNIGAGYFVGTNESGEVFIDSVP